MERYEITKMVFLWTYIFLLVLFLTETGSAKTDTVKVSLYYESLCPYSIEFVTEQMYPGYLKLRDAIILDLVPYGKANQTYVDGSWKFHCQHGLKECIGNKVQACALIKTFNRNNKLSFINCLMNSTDPSSSENGRKCALASNVQWTVISNCSTSTEGDTLLAHYGDRTKALTPKLTYVPHILFNGIFNQSLEETARDDFLKTVCSLLTVKPKSCNDGR